MYSFCFIHCIETRCKWYVWFRCSTRLIFNEEFFVVSNSTLVIHWKFSLLISEEHIFDRSISVCTVHKLKAMFCWNWQNNFTVDESHGNSSPSKDEFRFRHNTFWNISLPFGRNFFSQYFSNSAFAFREIFWLSETISQKICFSNN